MDIFNTLKNLIELDSVDYTKSSGHIVTYTAGLGMRLYLDVERGLLFRHYADKTAVINLNNVETYTPHVKETKNETTVSKSKGKAAPTGRSKKNTRTAPKSDGK